MLSTRPAGLLHQGLQSDVPALYWPTVIVRGSRSESGSIRLCGSSSGVEHHVANVGVEGSNPFSRFELGKCWTGGRPSFAMLRVRMGGPSRLVLEC